MRLADDICAIRNRDYIIDITLKFFHELFLFGLERNMIKYMIKYKSHTHIYESRHVAKTPIIQRAT